MYEAETEPVFCDVECFANYFLIAFLKGEKTKLFDTQDEFDERQTAEIRNIISRNCIVTFNGIFYDSVLITAAMLGLPTKAIKKISTRIIDDGEPPWKMLRELGESNSSIPNHIDLMPVAPLKASLKLYAARLGFKHLQDLPVDPYEDVGEEDITVLRKYCVNDLEMTKALYLSLAPEMDLRREMTREYRIDLRSKSDAQVAEAIIVGEMKKKYGRGIQKSRGRTGDKIRFDPPLYMMFNSPSLLSVLREYSTLPFIVQSSGHVAFKFANGKNQKTVAIDGSNYVLGIGGLHGGRKSVAYRTDDEYIIREYDVESYYPRIILNNGLAPKHLGAIYLDIYKSIVNKRLKAKRDGDVFVNESLKITINGSFGKFSSKYSVLYAPELFVQVVVIGQLTLLMLIEDFESAGIKVVSANTDGIVVKIPRDREEEVEAIIAAWESDTEYKMGRSDYHSIYYRDVNNYLAVSESGKVKGKGQFADQYDPFYRLRKNPNGIVCLDAVVEKILHGTPLMDTIVSCSDPLKFVTVRTVNGGAVKNGEWVGKVVRWYYSRFEDSAIHYQRNGNKVPNSDFAAPIMDAPESLPLDIDYAAYEKNAETMLKSISYGVFS